MSLCLSLALKLFSGLSPGWHESPTGHKYSLLSLPPQCPAQSLAQSLLMLLFRRGTIGVGVILYAYLGTQGLYKRSSDICGLPLEGHPCISPFFLSSPLVLADLTLGKDKNLIWVAGELGPSLDHTTVSWVTQDRSLSLI